MATMPTTTARSRATQASGFTLIEMLVVLGIMSLLAVVAVQATTRRPTVASRAQAAMTVKAAIVAAQAAAARSGQPATVELASLKLTGLNVTPAIGAATDRITLYPDRSSTGGTICRGERALVNVDWLTAEVRDAR